MASLRESKPRGTILRDKERYNSAHVEKRFSSRDSLFSQEFEGIIARNKEGRGGFGGGIYDEKG